MGPKGLLIDACPQCSGVWLDTGEVYHYVKDMTKLQALFTEAYKAPQPSTLICPRDQGAMAEVKLPPSGPMIEACPKCSGNWFDSGEIAALNHLLDKGIAPAASVAPKTPPASGSTWPQEAAVTPSWQEPASQPAPRGFSAAELPGLPNLGLRSMTVLGSLYGVMAAVCFVIIAVMKLPIELAFLGAALGIFLNFIIGPFLMDMSLRWMHSFRWVEPSELPPHLREFINKTCIKEGIPFPRCGIIEDDNPNAFTYGHVPNNARLVFSRGVLKMLSPEELEGVAGHEIGHIVHWDMLVMTLAMLVPLVLYGLYRGCLKLADKLGGDNGDRARLPLIVIGMIALLLHYLTEYMVLFLSRTRELHADRFGAELTGKPNALASALVKIAYGLAGRKEEAEGEAVREKPPQLASVMGIFDPVSAKALVASSLSGDRSASMANILGAMQWDMWNPWAGFYELHSTHPLPARRIELLGHQAESMGQSPYVRFDLKQPESYWDEFLVDVGALFLPWFLAAAGAGWGLLFGGMGARGWWLAGVGWGVGAFIRTWFSYDSDDYPHKNVSALLKNVKVSGVRSVGGTLRGKIIGKGIPGMIFSEDLVLQDNSGFLFMDYSQPLALFQWIFALRRGKALVGREVTARGWYRRSPVPYFELREIECDGETNTCRTLEAKYVFATLVAVASLIMSLGIY